MWFFYLFALVPIVIGAVLWVLRKEVVWQEWAVAGAIAFVLAAIFHAAAISGMTDDIQTISGQITYAKQFSAWQEYYEYAVYRTEYYTDTEIYTDDKGRSRTRTVTKSRQVFDHWEPTSRWHDISWESYSNINTSYNINETDFKFFVRVFNNRTPVTGTRTTWQHNSRMIGGDPNDYESYNKTGYIHPVNNVVSWVNKVKAAPSVFSYRPVPANILVFEYPKNENPFISDRLLGEAKKDFNIHELDVLNAKLGPTKKVNIILVGFGKQDSSLAHHQESKWIGGKKNDLVICYGSTEKGRVDWVYVFGWTERFICKQNIETLLLENGIQETTLSLIEAEVKNNYIIKDWTKFDYLTIEPPVWSYYTYILVLVLAQVGYWYFALNNEFKK